MDYIEQFARYMAAERRASPATVDIYTRDLRDFERYILDSAEEGQVFDPAQIRLGDIRSWIMRLSGAKIATGSINRKITTLRSFFRYLIRSGVVEVNPARQIKALRAGRQLPHFIEQSRMESLVRTLEIPSTDYETERDILVLLMLYACGLRRSELAGLRFDSVDLAAGTLRVMGKGAKERMIPLLCEITRRLEYYLQLREKAEVCAKDKNALFLSNKGCAITDQGVYRIVRNYLTEAQVQGKRSPHVLRHTFATHLMQHGASVRVVQQLLGHASLAATQIYTHNTIESLKETYNQAHPRAKMNPK